MAARWLFAVLTVHVYHVMRFFMDFTNVIGVFYPVFYLQQGCMCVTLLHSSTCVSCITSYYYSFVQYYCTWSHRNGDCPGQVVQAMPPPFVPWNDIGDPDLSVIPPPVDYRCCCCVTFYPMEGINFVFISFYFIPPTPKLFKSQIPIE